MPEPIALLNQCVLLTYSSTQRKRLPIPMPAGVKKNAKNELAMISIVSPSNNNTL